MTPTFLPEWNIHKIQPDTWSTILDNTLKEKGFFGIKNNVIKFFKNEKESDFQILKMSDYCSLTEKILLSNQISKDIKKNIKFAEYLRNKKIIPLLNSKKNSQKVFSSILTLEEKKTRSLEDVFYYSSQRLIFEEIRRDILLSEKSYISFSDTKIQKKLDEAISAGLIMDVEKILLFGADPTGNKNPTIYNAIENYCANTSNENYWLIVLLLIEAGADINKKNEFGETALDYAIREGESKVVKKLLEFNFDLDYLNSSAINFLEKIGKTDIINILFEAGTIIEGESILSIAVEKGDISEVEKLIKKFSSTPFRLRKLLTEENQFKKSVLAVAAMNNFIEIIELLLKAGASPNQITSSGKHLFHELFLDEKLILSKMCFKKFIDAGAILFSNKTMTVGIWSQLIQKKQIDLLILFLESWSDQNKTDQKESETKEASGKEEKSYYQSDREKLKPEISPKYKFVHIEIFQAILNIIQIFPDQTILIDLFFNSGLSINSINEFGDTLFIYLIKNTDISDIYISYFLKKGFDFRSKNKFNKTPIQVAFETEPKRLNVMNAYRKLGIDLNIQDDQGNSFFHIAIEKRNLSDFEFLIKNGFKPDLQNNLGITPLMLAISKGELEIIKNLLRLGLNLDLRDKENGNTALMYVMFIPLSKLRNEILVEFLKSKPKLNITNNNDQTAIIIAHLSSYLDTVEMLLKAGARDSWGRTQLMQVVRKNDVKKFDEIIDISADINCVDYEGFTVALHATYECNPKILKSLVKKGADFSLFSYSVLSPLENAIMQKKGESFLRIFTSTILHETIFLLAEEDTLYNVVFNKKGSYSKLTKFLDKNSYLLLELLFLYPNITEGQKTLREFFTYDDLSMGMKNLYDRYPLLDLKWVDELKFTCNDDYFVKEQKKLIIPLSSVETKIEGLLKFAYEITNDKSKFYCKPESFISDGKLIDKNKLESNLSSLIQTVNKKEKFFGSAETGSSKLIDYFNKLENFLKLIVEKLNDPELDKDKVAPALLDLAGVIGHCDARYMDDARDVYRLLTTKGGWTLCEEIDEILQNLRLATLEKIIAKSRLPSGEKIHRGNHLHVKNRYLYIIGKEKGIPGFDSAHSEETQLEHSYITIEKALFTFNQYYNPTEIINRIMIELKEPTKRDAFEMWFKENAVPETLLKEGVENRFEIIKNAYLEKQNELKVFKEKDITKFLDLQRTYINEILKSYRISPLKDIKDLKEIETAISVSFTKQSNSFLSEKELEKKRLEILYIISSASDPEKFIGIQVRKFFICDDRYSIDVGSDPSPSKWQAQLFKAIETDLRQMYFAKEICKPDTNEIKREAIANMLIAIGILTDYKG